MSALSDFRPTSHFPAGALQPTLANDTTQLSSGWELLDGTMLSRAAYPEAAAMLGDVRMCDATAITTQFPVINEVASYLSDALQGVVRDDGVLIGAGVQFTAAGSVRVFVLRSADGGENFYPVWIPVGIDAAWFNVHLQWLGGARVLAVFRVSPKAGGNYHWCISCSADLGATWTAVRSISLHADAQWFFGNNFSCTTDAQTTVDGSGHAYLCAPSPASGGTIVAVHVETGKVTSFAVAKDGSVEAKPMVMAGRALASGSSDLRYEYTTSAGRKSYIATVNAQTGSVLQGGSALLGSANLGGQVGGRFWVTRGGDGADYIATDHAVSVPAAYKLPASLLEDGLTAVANAPDVGRRLLDNALAVPAGGAYDTSAGRVIRRLPAAIPGHFGESTSAPSSTPVIWNARPARDRFVALVGGVPCFFDWRMATGFFSKFQVLVDTSRYVVVDSSGQKFWWYDSGTGVLKVVIQATTGLRVQAYAPAEDYEQYMQMPWMPGLACKLK